MFTSVFAYYYLHFVRLHILYYIMYKYLYFCQNSLYLFFSLVAYICIHIQDLFCKTETLNINKQTDNTYIYIYTHMYIYTLYMKSTRATRAPFLTRFRSEFQLLRGAGERSQCLRRFGGRPLQGGCGAMGGRRRSHQPILLDARLEKILMGFGN